MAVWGIFLNATLRAAVHLGQDFEANLGYVKKNLWNSVGQLFRETGKLIKLIVRKSFSDQRRQNQRLLRLCALRGENGR